MQEIMDGLLGEIREEVKRDIKQNIKSETQETIAEETVQPSDSPYSGFYKNLNGNFSINYVFTGTSYTATGQNIFGTMFISVVGTIEGQNTSFSRTRTEIPGAPTNFPANCTETGQATGVFSGSGEPGTTHTIMLPALCSEPMAFTGLHIKQ
jgi:hypothetical protein